MKKLLTALFLPLLTFAQTTTLTQEQCKDVYLVFDRGDGISTYYRITDALQVEIDKSTTATRLITNSKLKLEGFARSQSLTGDIFQFLPKPEAVPEHPDWTIGQYRNRYGSNYEREKSELASSGEAVFNFIGQAGVLYPEYGTTRPSTSTLVVMAFPTHSVVSTATSGADFVSEIEMKLTDQHGTLVWQLYDTKSGYHPSIRPNARGNNHPDDANRWLLYGKYQLYIKNRSSDKRAIQSMFFGTERGLKFIEQDLYSGQELYLDLDINPLADEYDAYKINCNVMPR